MREFLTGNQAVVRGALRAGCNFFAGYPITPANSILSDMVRALADGRGVALQTEDEIAAIGQCIGAAMAGAKAFTASSGPGLSLYSENIGLAQMGEVPLVIVNCQRMGPATGGATATGEGDVLFARHVTSGGYPLPVLAAADAASAYRLCHEAFNLAERFRTPVVLLLSKDISLTRQTVDLDDIVVSPRRERTAARGGAPFRPYAVEESAAVPAFAPLGGPQRVRFTGSIHDENGVLTTNRGKIAAKLTHLHDKILRHAADWELAEADTDAAAEVLIVSYGTADGAARDAIAWLRAEGTAVSHLTLYRLWPVPERALGGAVTPGIRRVIVPELNVGLYADELRRVIRNVPVDSITRFDGGLISPATIAGRVRCGTPGRPAEEVQTCRS
ncbi:MAG: pyruvate flavodoxin/ferredoxin oxidoreductase [Planctomycetes bacterium]|nr:pyruvate flavodoxin/ferredoxin oxidoreductase [Planctomycetota bacterium]